MMAIINHPTELTPGTLHYIIFFGDVKDEPFAKEEAPRSWCHFEGWVRILHKGERSWYAEFEMEDGNRAILSVDMVTGKELIRNLWEELKDAK